MLTLPLLSCSISGGISITLTTPSRMRSSARVLQQVLMNGRVAWQTIAVFTALTFPVNNSGSLRGTAMERRGASLIGRLPQELLVLKVAFGVSLLTGSYLSSGMTLALFAALLWNCPILMEFALLGVSKISLYGTQVSCSPTKTM